MPSNQASWAKNEIFLLLGDFMNPSLDEEETLRIFKKLSGWMVFAKDDTLLSVYYEACEKRLLSLEKCHQKEAAKHVLKCAKNYRYSKEYLALLKLAKNLIE